LARIPCICWLSLDFKKVLATALTKAVEATKLLKEAKKKVGASKHYDSIHLKDVFEAQ
jgi:hypothetical protein